jgi:hypothetical protein
MDAAPLARIAATAEFRRLAQTHMILALHPRGVLGEPDPQPERLALGQYMGLSLRALIVGKTLVGMRMDDTIRALDWLVSLPQVDASSITLYATGAPGMVGLHAAVLDTRVSDLVIERTLVSYDAARRAGLHRNLSESLVPQVLLHYDTVDLLASIASAALPRRVSLANPVNALGQRLLQSQATAVLQPALDVDRSPGPAAVRILSRAPGEGQPIR